MKLALWGGLGQRRQIQTKQTDKNKHTSQREKKNPSSKSIIYFPIVTSAMKKIKQDSAQRGEEEKGPALSSQAGTQLQEWKEAGGQCADWGREGAWEGRARQG